MNLEKQIAEERGKRNFLEGQMGGGAANSSKDNVQRQLNEVKGRIN